VRAGRGPRTLQATLSQAAAAVAPGIHRSSTRGPRRTPAFDVRPHPRVLLAA
jgi:hypothetical protein